MVESKSYSQITSELENFRVSKQYNDVIEIAEPIINLTNFLSSNEFDQGDILRISRIYAVSLLGLAHQEHRFHRFHSRNECLELITTTKGGGLFFSLKGFNI